MKKLVYILLLLSLSGTSFASKLKFVAPNKDVTIVGIVTCAYSQNDKHYAYIEQGDRSSGVCLETTELLARGDAVKASGKVHLLDRGELTVVTTDSVDVTLLDANCPVSPPIALPQSMLGGGQFGYQPATEGGVGLNNTGLLVRLAGTVTSVNTTYSGFELTPCYVIYMDDGSGRKSDLEGVTGTKVYCQSGRYSAGQFIEIDGVVSTEKFSDGTIHPVIRETVSVSGLARGIVSTLTVSVSCGLSASGKKARVSTDAGSCEILLNSSGTGSGELKLPAGDYAVTCALPGFMSDLKKVSLPNSGIAVNFSLVTAETIIDVLPRSAKVMPGQNTEVDVLVRDVMGNPIGNADLTWTSSPGSITNAVMKTDSNGMAHATLSTTNVHCVTAIKVSSCDAIGFGYVDQMTAGDPYLRIVEPIDGAIARGLTNLKVECADTNVNGSNDIYKRQLFVDGIACGTFTNIDSERPGGFQTNCFSNGWHAITTTAQDREGHSMLSNAVSVNIQNELSEVNLSQNTMFCDDETVSPFIITGYNNTPHKIRCIITDYLTDEIVFSQVSSGTTGSFSFSWDGKVTGAYPNTLCRVTFEKVAHVEGYTGPTIGPTDPTTYITVTQKKGIRGLILGSRIDENGSSLSGVAEEIKAVAKAFKLKGIRYTILMDPYWESAHEVNPMIVPKSTPTVPPTPSPLGPLKLGMDYWLRDSVQSLFIQYLFFAGNGDTKKCDDGVQRSLIYFDDGGEAYGFDSWSYHPDTTDAFTDLCIPYFQYKMVIFNGCNTAGNWQYSDDPTIAMAFKVYAKTYGGVYLGWLSKYYMGGAANGTGFTKGLFRRMSEENQSFGEALFQLRWNPELDELGWMQIYLKTYGDCDWWDNPGVYLE